MSKTQLQTNNEKYNQLIELLKGKTVGGGSLETCTIYITGDITSPLSSPFQFTAKYTNKNCESVTETFIVTVNEPLSKEINVIKNSLVYIQATPEATLYIDEQTTTEVFYGTLDNGYIIGLVFIEQDTEIILES